MNKRNEKFEFKVKLADTWEESPVLCTRKIRISRNSPEAYEFAQKLSNMLDKEVRWQFAWGNQGHYVSPEKEPEKQ
jgi:hypothetical protein